MGITTMRGKERIVADAPDELIWIRLARLRSSKLCESLLREKIAQQGASAKELSEEVLQKKAIGVSSAIDSGIGYWKAESDALNSWILSRYYALLQMTIAEQVASITNDDDLASIQRHTVFGHG